MPRPWHAMCSLFRRTRARHVLPAPCRPPHPPLRRLAPRPPAHLHPAGEGHDRPARPPRGAPRPRHHRGPRHDGRRRARRRQLSLGGKPERRRPRARAGPVTTPQPARHLARCDGFGSTSLPHCRRWSVQAVAAGERSARNRAQDPSQLLRWPAIRRVVTGRAPRSSAGRLPRVGSAGRGAAAAPRFRAWRPRRASTPSPPPPSSPAPSSCTPAAAPPSSPHLSPPNVTRGPRQAGEGGARPRIPHCHGSRSTCRGRDRPTADSAPRSVARPSRTTGRSRSVAAPRSSRVDRLRPVSGAPTVRAGGQKRATRSPDARGNEVSGK